MRASQAMTRSGRLLLLGALLAALTGTSWGQRASNWQVYKVADGLPESACISVGTGPPGRVLVRHVRSPTISELDGYAVTNIPLAQPGNGRVYGSVGGRFWALAEEGVLEFRQGDWELHRVPEIAAEFRAGRLRLFETPPLCRLWPLRQGLVLVLLADRLLEVNCDSPGNARVTVLRTAAQSQLQKFSSLGGARDGGLWISGEGGVAKVAGPLRNLKPESDWQEYVFPAAMQVQNMLEPHEQAEGHLTGVAQSGTNQQRVVVHLDGQQWSVETVGTERIRQAWRGPDNTCWAMTGSSLYQWEEGATQMVENEEISARQYFDVAIEPSGVFWLATSDGLYRCDPPLWRSPRVGQKLNTLVHGLAADLEGRLWFIAGGAVHSLKEGQHREYPFPPGSPLRSLPVRAVYPLKDGSLLLVSEPGPEKEEGREQLFTFRPASGAFNAVFPAGRDQALRVVGSMKDGGVCLQIDPGVPAENYRLEKYDGLHRSRLLEPAPEMALGATLSSLFTAQNGDLWVSGERGTACYHDHKWRTFASSDDFTPAAALAFIEVADGKVWCATREQVWEFDGRGWSAVRRGFDGINALVRTRDGSVWVASNSGLHRFLKGTWVENGVPEGLPTTAVREVCEDQRGQIWAGTTRGLSAYHPDADTEAPVTSVQNLVGDNVPEGGMITLAFNGADRWKYTPVERLLFSYRLDERDWTVFHEASGVSFSDLPAGKHYFQVRAMDRNGNVDPKPARREFAFVLPWYKEARLVLSSSAGLAAALFFAILAFNRHRRLLRSYAEVEKKVAERTSELELAGRELMHSQKMTALGTLAAGIAHDFNNILSIIKGSAQLIEDNLDRPEKVRTRLERINTVVEQGSGIVKAMLGFSRDSSTQPPAPCDVNEVAAETIKLLGDRFLREVQVSFKPAAGLPAVVASKDFIQQILLNFVFNAAECMAKRKEIILATGALEVLPPGMDLAPAPAGAYVFISVQDFGCGITPEIRPRIFEPFFTTKALSARRGTGLGLSMAYELAKKLHAGLAVESVVEQGSTFALILPVPEVSAQPPPPGP